MEYSFSQRFMPDKGSQDHKMALMAAAMRYGWKGLRLGVLKSSYLSSMVII